MAYNNICDPDSVKGFYANPYFPTLKLSSNTSSCLSDVNSKVKDTLDNIDGMISSLKHLKGLLGTNYDMVSQIDSAINSLNKRYYELSTKNNELINSAIYISQSISDSQNNKADIAKKINNDLLNIDIKG